MNENDGQIILELKWRLPAEVSCHLKQFIVFGSRARGGAAQDSDLDLIALVDRKDSEIEAKLADVADSVMWDHDFNPMVSWRMDIFRMLQSRKRWATRCGVASWPKSCLSWSNRA